MYCSNCGSRLPDDARFCPNCGAARSGASAQKSSPAPKKRGFGTWVLRVFIASLILTAVNHFTAKPAPQKTVEIKPAATVAAPSSPAPSSRAPQSGWYEKNGKRYYYSGGTPMTGLQEIGGVPYYFKSDGSLASNTTAQVNGLTLEIGSGGRITGLTVPQVSGDWSSESYHYGNGGRSSIMELETEIENCDRTDIYIEAKGNYGASVSCNWKIYVRSHGTWVFAKEVYFSEPSGTFQIRFDSPMDFDAVTAYPTVQGNASYSCYFAPVNVHIVQ